MMNDSTPTAICGEFGTFGSRLSKTLSLYAAHPIPFLLIALVYVPISIAERLWVPGLFVLLIPSFVISDIIHGAGAFATSRALQGAPPEAGTSLLRTLKLVVKLVEYDLRYLSAFFLLLFTIVGIPWAIRLLIRWSLGSQGIVLHDLNAKDSIAESFRLISGNWWRVFGNTVASFIPTVLRIAIVFAIGVRTTGAVVSITVSTIVTPVVFIFITLLYLRLRYEKAQTPPSSAAMIS